MTADNADVRTVAERPPVAGVGRDEVGWKLLGSSIGWMIALDDTSFGGR